MKYLYVLLSLFISIGCCACGTDSPMNNSSAEQELTVSAEIAPIPPPTEYTLEELTSQTVDFRDYIISSYQNIQELANDDKSHEAGKELVKKIEEQYGERIAELADMDFTGMTKEELTEYLSEFTSLTTVIREAKDALTLG